MLRNHHGVFVSAFAVWLGSCSVVMAELWAIFHGLSHAFHHGYYHLEVESDSQAAVRLIQSGCSASHPCALLVRRVRNLISRAFQVRVAHIHREANQVADVLAKLSLHQEGPQVFDTAPQNISLALFADSCSISFPRGF